MYVVDFNLSDDVNKFYETSIIKKKKALQNLFLNINTPDTPIVQWGSAGHVSERVWVGIPGKPWIYMYMVYHVVHQSDSKQVPTKSYRAPPDLLTSCSIA
jgi:hypothetical protein